MDTRHIETFLAAANSENFRQTARERGITQPAVSQQIRAIESELGVLLFKKNGRGVEATEAGKLLANAAQAIMREVDDFSKIANMLRRNELGRIAVGYSTSIMSEEHLPRILRQFAEAHPSIELTVDPMRVSDAIEALIDHRIDIAVVRSPLPPVPSCLVWHPFDRSQLVLAVPIGHALIRGRAIEWSELSGLDIMSMRDPEGVGLRHVTETLLADNGVVARKMRLLTDMTTLVGLVAAGVGVALLPEEIARAHRGIAVLAIGSAPYFIESVIVTRQPITATTVRHLATRLSQSRI